MDLFSSLPLNHAMPSDCGGNYTASTIIAPQVEGLVLEPPRLDGGDDASPQLNAAMVDEPSSRAARFAARSVGECGGEPNWYGSAAVPAPSAWLLGRLLLALTSAEGDVLPRRESGAPRLPERRESASAAEDAAGSPSPPDSPETCSGLIKLPKRMPGVMTRRWGEPARVGDLEPLFLHVR
jgi:hypothetical protein